MKTDLLTKIKELAKELPNDMEFGKAIRELLYNAQCCGYWCENGKCKCQ